MDRTEKWAAMGRVGAFIGGLILIAAILWIDIKTSFWQDLVILAGLAGSLVTFLLTFLVINQVTARATERRWEPVTRMALTDLLHDLADEDQSELSRGVIVPRSLPVPEPAPSQGHRETQLAGLRHQVVAERHRLTKRLAVWSEFLASSGKNDRIMTHVAKASLQLDEVRDAALALEERGSSESWARLRAEVIQCNEHLAALAAEIEQRLRQHRQGITKR